MVEIERKFLVRSLPAGLDSCPTKDIEQGYLATQEPLHMRVRVSGSEAVLTIKHGGGMERTEVEIGLTPGQQAALWPLTRGRRLLKTRYSVPAGGIDIDLDVYHGALSGLVVCEAEFGSREEAMLFHPLEWMGAEVTGDPRYSNFALAGSQRIPERTPPG